MSARLTLPSCRNCTTEKDGIAGRTLYISVHDDPAPSNKIVGELPEMRRDTMELVKRAMEEKRRAYVIVNNRSEGNAPLTIQALTKALQRDDE
jgi:uncharacterized protein YecE (DUF72 family)